MTRNRSVFRFRVSLYRNTCLASRDGFKPWREAWTKRLPQAQKRGAPRPYTGLPDIDYPLHDKTIVVTRCGRICLGKKKINFSQVFAGQAVVIKEVHDGI
jgi:hypothetical protein